jgi:hypothetical protein
MSTVEEVGQTVLRRQVSQEPEVYMAHRMVMSLE